MSAVATHRVVNSRAELEQYLAERPLQLRAARSPRPPRAGHPDFIGPVDPLAFGRLGSLQFDAEGAPFIKLLPPLTQDVWRAGGNT